MTTAVRISRFGEFGAADPKMNTHDPHSSSRHPSLAQPLSKNGLDWSSSIWGNGTIGTVLGNAKQDYAKPRVSPPRSSLFPPMSDSDPWSRRDSHWTPINTQTLATGARRSSAFPESQFKDTDLPPIPQQPTKLPRPVDQQTSFLGFKPGEIQSRDKPSSVSINQEFDRGNKCFGDQRDAPGRFNSWAAPSFPHSPSDDRGNHLDSEHIGPPRAGPPSHKGNILIPRNGVAALSHIKPSQDWLSYQQNQSPRQDPWSIDSRGSSAFAPFDRKLSHIPNQRDPFDLSASLGRVSIADEHKHPNSAPSPGVKGSLELFLPQPFPPEPTRPANPQGVLIPPTTGWGNSLYMTDTFVPRPFADQFESFRNFQPANQPTQELNETGIRRCSSDYQTSMRGKPYADSELVVTPPRVDQSLGGHTSNRPAERWYAYAQQEQEQLMRHHMQQMMAVHMRGQYLNQFAYGLPDFSMTGCLPYLPMPPMMMQSRVPATELGSESDADRSALLEEFRNSLKTNRRFELREIYDHIVEFSGDQHGSRFIQQKLETANSDEKERVFRELCRDAIALMKDVFGNYVIQKFFEHGDQNQKKVLAHKMKGQVLELTTQIYGCRVVQKALEHVLVDQQVSIMKELEHHILKCVKDQHGNHVIQVAIGRVPAEFIRVIANALVGQVYQLASHPFGCRVVQRVLERTDVPETAMILRELHASALELIADQYGNYVTGHVIEHGTPEDRETLISLVIANFIFFAKQKFASHVVEKSIEFGTDEQRRNMTLQLSTKDGLSHSPLPLLIKDSFGNYVIQKLLDYLNDVDYAAFVELLKPEIVNARRLTTNNKQADNVAKKMHRLDPPFTFHHHMNTVLRQLNLDISATSTPALTTDGAHSPFSSSLPSTIGDALPPQMEYINPSAFPNPEIKIEITEP